MRPLSQRETRSGDASCWTCAGTSIRLSPPRNLPLLASSSLRSKSLAFNFDRVAGPQESTQQLYEACVRDVVLSGVDGQNVVVMAYGQTSTGKTYTMQGTPTQPGVLPLSVLDLFDRVRRSRAREFLIRVSYMEVYNEHVYDLLRPRGRSLPLLEHPDLGCVARGLTEQVVSSEDQLFSLIALGETHRHIAATHYNAASSRAHSLLRVVVESRLAVGASGEGENAAAASAPAGVRLACMHFADLAGSESLKHPPPDAANGSGGGGSTSPAPSPGSRQPPGTRVPPSSASSPAASLRQGSASRLAGMPLPSPATLATRDTFTTPAATVALATRATRRTEGGFINRSLLALAHIVQRLSEAAQRGQAGAASHLPYRDSKLTRLMQASLRGNARVCVLATITPAATSVEESVNTLKFASRARKIRYVVRVNEVAAESALIQRYKRQIAALQRELARYRGTPPTATRPTLRDTGGTNDVDGRSDDDGDDADAAPRDARRLPSPEAATRHRLRRVGAVANTGGYDFTADAESSPLPAWREEDEDEGGTDDESNATDEDEQGGDGASDPWRGVRPYPGSRRHSVVRARARRVVYRPSPVRARPRSPGCDTRTRRPRPRRRHRGCQRCRCTARTASTPATRR